jgi:D-lyxose ketol-isomerase
MSQLTATQVAQCAAYWALQNFVVPNVTAKYSLDQIQTAVSAIDAAFDTTLSAAVTAVGGSTTIANGLSSQITASMAGASVAQQTLLVCYVLMKRAGII